MSDNIDTGEDLDKLQNDLNKLQNDLNITNDEVDVNSKKSEASDPVDIKAILDGLSDKLNATNKEIAKDSKTRDDLSADIKDLSKNNDDIDKWVGDYSKVFDNLKKDKEGLDRYAEKIKAMISAALSDSDRKEIDDKIEEVDGVIHNQETILRNFDDAYKSAQSKFDEANKNVTIMQTQYDNLKTYQKTVSNKLITQKNVRGSIESEEVNNNFPNMYFLSKKLNDKVDLFAVEAYRAQLNGSLNELYKAKTNVRDKEEIMKSAQADSTNAQNILDSMNKDRDQNILDKINKKEGQ